MPSPSTHTHTHTRTHTCTHTHTHTHTTHMHTHTPHTHTHHTHTCTHAHTYTHTAHTHTHTHAHTCTCTHTKDKRPIKKKNMASGATIRVCVLEGQYTQLSNLGFPVSLVMELQQGGLRLGNAKWSSRLSDSDFSVSFLPHLVLPPSPVPREPRLQ